MGVEQKDWGCGVGFAFSVERWYTRARFWQREGPDVIRDQGLPLTGVRRQSTPAWQNSPSDARDRAYALLSTRLDYALVNKQDLEEQGIHRRRPGAEPVRARRVEGAWLVKGTTGCVLYGARYAQRETQIDGVKKI